MAWVGSIPVALFCLFWTGIVGAFDVIIARDLGRQLRAHDFATTRGMITASSVAQERGSKGRSVYRPAIRYAYVVAGRDYEGSRYRYQSGATSDSGWAEAAVRDHPVGAATSVRYDPLNPADSVLSVGLDGADLFLPLFLTPFNLVMFALWWAGAAWGWRKLRNAPGPDLGGVRSVVDGARTRVRLDPLPAFAYGVIATGLAAFVSIFIIGFSSGFHPSLRVMLIVWTAVLGTGIFVWVRQAHAHHAGARDLVIDHLTRSVDLPTGFGRKQRVLVMGGEIAGIDVTAQARPGRRGRDTIIHVIALRRRDGRGETLLEWYDEPHARALAAWLREKIGLR